MNDSRLILGIDTSCYTTSVAAKCGDSILHFKKMLDVKSCECGLRQSDAVFQHTNRFAHTDLYSVASAHSVK